MKASKDIDFSKIVDLDEEQANKGEWMENLVMDNEQVEEMDSDDEEGEAE